jgi:hypothetical protein
MDLTPNYLVFYALLFFAYFPYFEKMKARNDHHAVHVPVCLCACYHLQNGCTNLYET